MNVWSLPKFFVDFNIVQNIRIVTQLLFKYKAICFKYISWNLPFICVVEGNCIFFFSNVSLNKCYYAVMMLTFECSQIKSIVKGNILSKLNTNSKLRFSITTHVHMHRRGLRVEVFDLSKPWYQTFYTSISVHHPCMDRNEFHTETYRKILFKNFSKYRTNFWLANLRKERRQYPNVVFPL